MCDVLGVSSSGYYDWLDRPESARGKEYEKIFTFVRADNREALQFYLKLGFRVVGTAERQARIGGNYVDEVIIEKFL